MVGLGIDAGGSASRWVLLSSDGALQRGLTPPLSGLITHEAERHRASAALEALIAAARTAGQPQAVVAGIAGLSAGGEAAAYYRARLADAFGLAAERVLVDDDVRIAYLSVFRPGEGVLVYSGTGSAAYFESPTGASYRAGGYGFAIDDAGSGFWLGREALKAALRQRDAQGEGARSLLAEELFKQLGSREWPTLRARIYRDPRRELAALAPAVVRAAQRGDPTAQALLAAAGRELAELALALFRRLGQLYPVALAGGLTRAGSPLSDSLKAALPVPLRLAEADAARSAARLALQLAFSFAG